MRPLTVLVLWTLLGTVAVDANRPHPLYRVCLGLQAITLAGIATRSYLLVQTGHVGFAVVVYAGALVLPYPDAYAVALLCGVALITRHLVGGCLFDQVAGGDLIDVPAVVVDLFFTVPIVLVVGRPSL